MLTYPMSSGRNFDAVLRLLDRGQVTAEHQVATPVNWRQGEGVIIDQDQHGARGVRRGRGAQVPGRLEGAEALPAHRAAAAITEHAAGTQLRNSGGRSTPRKRKEVT